MDRISAATAEALRRFADDGENRVAVYYGSAYIDRKPALEAFLSGRRFLYHRAACVNDHEQLRRLTLMLRERGVSLSGEVTYEAVFSAIISMIPAGRRLVLLFDDFENFFYEKSGFTEALFRMLDAPEHAGRITVFLLSDDEVWVENSLVERAGSYAGRIDGFVKKRPAGFAELRAAFPGLSMRDAIAWYAVFGGETALWQTIDPAASFKNNICRLFLTDAHPASLSDLAEKRLAELVREPAVYATILANLADGKEKLNDLYHATGIPRAKLSVYLKTLMSPGFVEKVFSYGVVGARHTKKGVYRISNAFMRFSYAALYPHPGAALYGDPARAYDLWIAPSLAGTLNNAYRIVCTEYINRLDEQSRLPFAIAEEGEWNGKAGAIDIVAESEEGETLIGLCAYDRILTEDDYHFALQYARQAGLDPDHCYLFSGEGFGSELTTAARHVAGLHLIGLEELEHV